MSDIFYTKDHEWIKVNGNEGIVGITAYASEQLGDIVFADIITKPEDKRVYHGSGANYINALASATNCAPIILPALPGINNYRKILDRVDGICY